MFAATPRSCASVGDSSVASRSMARPARAPEPGEVISLAAAAAAMASTTADSGTGDWPMSAAAPGELSAARAMALSARDDASGLGLASETAAMGCAGGLDLPTDLDGLLAPGFFATTAGLAPPAGGGLGLTRFAGGGVTNLSGFEILRFARPSLTPTAAGGGVAAGAANDMVRTVRCRGTARTVCRAGRGPRARPMCPISWFGFEYPTLSTTFLNRQKHTQPTEMSFH